MKKCSIQIIDHAASETNGALRGRQAESLPGGGGPYPLPFKYEQPK